MHQITIPIRGMSCDGCARSVGQALRRLSGVNVATVFIGSATLTYDPAVIDLDTLLTTIEGAGYVPYAV